MKRRNPPLPGTDDTGRLFGIITDPDLRSAAFAPALIERLSVGAQRRETSGSAQGQSVRPQAPNPPRARALRCLPCGVPVPRGTSMSHQAKPIAI
jgi:hypothetical protein